MKEKDCWNAQHYKKHSDSQFKGGLKIVSELLLSGNETVLDVGCGDGKTTLEIAKRVPEGSVLGIDKSKNMIDEADKLLKDIKNLKFKCVDAEKFSSDNQFDLVVSFSAFHWIEDQETALKNIYEALKPDGKLIMRLGVKQNHPVNSVYENEKWKPVLGNKGLKIFLCTAEDFAKLLEDAGFKNINVQTKEKSCSFQNKKDLFNWSLAWLPHATGLGEEKAKELAQDIVDYIYASDEDGRKAYKSKYLLVQAEK